MTLVANTSISIERQATPPKTLRSTRDNNTHDCNSAPKKASVMQNKLFDYFATYKKKMYFLC